MNNNLVLLFLFSITMISTNCTLNGFGKSSSVQNQVVLQDSSLNQNNPLLTYCNIFSNKDFEGVIVANYDWEKKEFTKKQATLYLTKLPYDLQYNKYSLQLYTFSINNNNPLIRSKDPIFIDIIHKESSQIAGKTNTISIQSVQDMNILDTDTLIADYQFRLYNINGWQGITLSILDAHASTNNLVREINILLPPFESNPLTYSVNHNYEDSLNTLHPFYVFSGSHTDEFYYTKGRDECSKYTKQIPQYETLTLL